MKTAMIAAVMVSMVIADDCDIHVAADRLRLSCTIPSVSTISSSCCRGIQSILDKQEMLWKNGQTPDPQDVQQEQQQVQQSCSSFAMYVNSRMSGLPPVVEQHHVSNGFSMGLNPSTVINALPDGLTCTESIVGDDESACKLTAKQEKLGVTCEIPKSTTITAPCCNALQHAIHVAEKHDHPTMQEQQEGQEACQSVESYFAEHKPPQVAGSSPSSVEGAVKQAIKALPGGLSCTEMISGGDLSTLSAHPIILSAISLAASASSPAHDEISVMPTAVSGITGFLAGGLLVAGILYRYSKKQQVSLLSDVA